MNSQKLMKYRPTVLRLLALLSLLLMLSALFMSCGGASSWKNRTEYKTEAKTVDALTDEDRANLTALEKEYLEEDADAPAIEGAGDILGIPFGYVMQGCSYVTGHIYVLALLLFTVVMKLILLPFGVKQQKNMMKQAAFAPRQKAIQDKYAGRTDRETMQKMQQELMDAQKEAGVSMFGGCLPLLIQFPALICLYSVIQYPLRYMAHLSSYLVSALKVRALTLPADKLGSVADTVNAALTKGKSLAEVAEGINQIKLIPIIRDNFDHFADLLQGTAVSAADLLPNFGFFGLSPDLSATPSINPINWLIAIPVVVFLSYFFSMKLTRKFSYQPPVAEGQPDAAKSMKIMDFMMPLFSVYISFTVPSGLAIYWIYSSLLGILQQYLLTKFLPFPQFTEEEYKEAKRIYNGKAQKKKKPDGESPDAVTNGGEARPKVRSLHHIDDEDDITEPEALQSTPVSSRYGDEDEPDAPKPVEKAPVKGLFGRNKKD